ncbi:MAG TPA: GNAT family N-acetyltransferase [Bacteroidetes bacterium]|nr:GNAT family N-acetyltransferase [Bacteroidota bacterium]
MQTQIHIEEATQEAGEDYAYVLGQLRAYNESHASHSFVRKRIHLYARNKKGKIVGGCFAAITFHTLSIQILWVEASMRRSGTGKLLLEKVENIAREMGTIWSTVETTSFQARPFYERMGYKVFADLADSPIGDTCYWLKKRLNKV